MLCRYENLPESSVAKRGLKTLTVTVSAALLVLLLHQASAVAGPLGASLKTAYFGPLGLTTTSSARLNVLAEDPVQVELLFLDSSGTTVADSGAVSLAAGQATNLTLAGSSLTYAPGALRAQVQARVRLLSPPGHSLAFASLELLDPDSTVLVLYPIDPCRALATTTLLLGPLTLSSTSSAGITLGNLSGLNFPNDPCKAVLSFLSVDGTVLTQQAVTVQPGQTATLSMSGATFSGPVIGTVSFDSSTALTVSSLQVFDTTTGITRVALYPIDPCFSTGAIAPAP